MLARLHIRNLAVLDEVTLELAGGFSVLTGETGAGKSMLVDALALALGARADSNAVRTGAQRAEVSAFFDLDAGSAIAAWLRDHDLDSDAEGGVGECILRRVVGAEGRSRGYVNGRPVPVEMLRELGGQLVEICGQHAYQSLGQRATQRDLLDAFGNHGALRSAVADAHAAWSALQAEQASLLSAQGDRQAREDLLRYQVQELAALGLQAGEAEALEQEQRLLANATGLAAGLALALEQLHDADEGSAQRIIASALRDIRALAEVDVTLIPAAGALEQAAIDLREATEQLRRRLGAIEDDPERLAHVESRMAAVQDLARKHRCPPEALGSLLGQLQAELAGLGAGEDRLRTIAGELAAQEKALREAAGRLTQARQHAAAAFAAAVSARLGQLGMPGSALTVHLAPLGNGQISASGGEQVEFLASTNPGQAPGPIARVASGGELSRLSLAVQLVCTADGGPATLIFDEVDAGIGGGVAEIVGQCLRDLGGRRQVVCVTHLAQVASQATRHYAVSKHSTAQETRTRVQDLGHRERVEEIARMLGGVAITERSRAHAREMLQARGSRRAG